MPRRAIEITAFAMFAVLIGVGATVARAERPLAPARQAAADAPERIDYLTFAQGAVPVRIGGAGAAMGATFEHAVRMMDGDATVFPFVQRAEPETDTEFVYRLPALTTFNRFAVPNVLETPSPNQTFARSIEIHGSATGSDADYTLLASATLKAHSRPGQVTEIPVAASTPVRWVKLRLVGGLDPSGSTLFFEFSELIGNGRQETPPLDERFNGTWRDRAVRLALKQDGPVVTGCYDANGRLTGTVTGNILRATGISQSDKAPSAFLLSVADDGSMRGVRSTNGSPFRLYAAPAVPAAEGPTCGDPPPPTLGCGSIVHGITFDFDSADIRPESEPVLARLYDGLRADPSASITIEGHTSSEGGTDYNQRLSERRAAAVVADLVRRGIDASRLKSVGIGELRPIASNHDESGRSLNRRVEVKCAG